MIEQLKTIREFIESVHEGEWAPYAGRYEALTALTQLEAMVGEQKPICWAESDGEGGILWDQDSCFSNDPAWFDSPMPLYAAPVAQQHKTVTNDEQASAYMDARLWEFIDMAGMWPKAKPDPRIWAHVMVYAPPAQQQEPDLTSLLFAVEQAVKNGHCPWEIEAAFDEYEAARKATPVAQQPQADSIPVAAFDRLMALCESQAQRIIELEDKQPQAEAVPSDVVRDAAPIPAHELVTMYDERPTSDLEMIEFAREVERRHGIGVQPQHITDGSQCWCNPDVAYTDPETGASVIVHRRPQ